jgi:hypothetical protein
MKLNWSCLGCGPIGACDLLTGVAAIAASTPM